MRVTVLVENDSTRPDLQSEHGLSMWIEATGHRILFDTGASDSAMRNAEVLGIDLSTADAIVVSHGHRDHTGGIAAAARRAGGAAIFAGPDITRPRYARRDEGLREIGLDHPTINAVAHRFRVAQDGHRLVPGISVLSQFPTEFPVPEDNKRLLVRGETGLQQDPFDDEIALLVESSGGPVLVTGCSHSGIGNIVAKARSRCEQLQGLVGGLHLHKETDENVRRAADSLTDISRIYAGHCTGEHAVDLLRSLLGNRVVRLRTGDVIDFP